VIEVGGLKAASGPSGKLSPYTVRGSSPDGTLGCQSKLCGSWMRRIRTGRILRRRKSVLGAVRAKEGIGC
jgi:hypothetical protein